MNTSEVLDSLRKALSQPSGGGSDPLNKAWTTASGLVNYDLQRPAIALYPWGQEVTPLRTQLPRVTSNKGDTATHWKGITAINTTKMPIGISEGQRGGVISTTVQDFTAAYRTIGLEDYVTFEEDQAAESFDDAKARAVEGLLRSVMIAEEYMILGGNSSINLGVAPTPTGAGNATGGALSDGTYYIGCVALTHDGWYRATVAAGVVQTIVRNNADGSTDTINGGTSQPSVLSAGVTLNAGTAVQRVTAHVTAVKGAIAYAWYLGNSNTHQYLQQITTINSVNFNTTYVTNTQDFQTLAATDNSADSSFSFDGLLYQGPFKANTGSYYAALPTGTDGVGSTLTSDSAGGIVEINAAFKSFYDNYKLSPDTIWVNTQQAQDINSKVIAGGGAPLFRFTLDGQAENMGVVGGVVVKGLVNKFANTQVAVRIHPWMPAGTILFTSKRIPYALSGVGNVAQIKCQRDYYQLEWPLRTRKYEYGVYATELLQIYFLPAFGAITNIAAG